MAISVPPLGRRLPTRTKNGTPAQRQLSMFICRATKVSMTDSLVDILFVAISRDAFAVDGAGAVLGADDGLAHILAGERAEGF